MFRGAHKVGGPNISPLGIFKISRLACRRRKNCDASTSESNNVGVVCLRAAPRVQWRGQWMTA